MITSCKPAITWSWPTNLSSTALTVESALTYPTDGLRGSWKWQGNSMNFEGSKKRSKGWPAPEEWFLQSIKTGLYLKDWCSAGAVWTDDPKEAITWLNPDIPAGVLQHNSDLFGNPESFRLVSMTFERTFR